VVDGLQDFQVQNDETEKLEELVVHPEFILFGDFHVGPPYS
jgi:hypothetical protein